MTSWHCTISQDVSDVTFIAFHWVNATYCASFHAGSSLKYTTTHISFTHHIRVVRRLNPFGVKVCPADIVEENMTLDIIKVICSTKTILLLLLEELQIRTEMD
jgi:hypothetical protein